VLPMSHAQRLHACRLPASLHWQQQSATLTPTCLPTSTNASWTQRTQSSG
jgi:hypothetical protein